MGLFSSDKTYTLTPQLTPEQQQAQTLLLALANGGNIAGLNLGQSYNGSYGNFTPTGTEQSAIQGINGLLNAGTPSALTTAENTLTKLADTTFNPSDPSSGYAAYARQVARAQGQANDVINRESAITGNRFGDRILNTKRDLAMQGSDQLATYLANLFNTAQDRAGQAAQGLTSLAGTQNNIALNNLNTASTIGSLQRMLDTAKAQAQYQDWQRARNERLGTSVDALNNVWQRQVPYGISSLTTSQQTPFGSLLNAGLGAIGTAVGEPIGGAIGSKISSLFSGGGGGNPIASSIGSIGNNASAGFSSAISKIFPSFSL